MCEMNVTHQCIYVASKIALVDSDWSAHRVGALCTEVPQFV